MRRREKRNNPAKVLGQRNAEHSLGRPRVHLRDNPGQRHSGDRLSGDRLSIKEERRLLALAVAEFPNGFDEITWKAHACERKVKYESKQAAFMAAFHVGARESIDLDSYECVYCGWWHIGKGKK